MPRSTLQTSTRALSNGFEHDPEEAARVRVRLLRELAVNRELLVALTCRSRPSAMWRSPATSFVGYQAPGSTDRLLTERQAATSGRDGR